MSLSIYTGWEATGREARAEAIALAEALDLDVPEIETALKADLSRINAWKAVKAAVGMAATDKAVYQWESLDAKSSLAADAALDAVQAAIAKRRRDREPSHA